MEIESKDYLKYRTLCAVPEDMQISTFYMDEWSDFDILFDFTNKGEYYDLWKKYKKTDISGAIHWLQRAAYYNHIEAQYELAECYESGYGVVKDEEEMVSWYISAATQGHVKAQSKLGSIYSAEGNLEEALKWYKEAAAKDDVYAQIGAADILYNRSLKRRRLFPDIQESLDVINAYGYYNAAASNGAKNAEDSILKMLKDRRIRKILKWHRVIS